MPEVNLVGISASYGRITALRDVDLHVPDGGVVGVLGANGAGKSTLMKVLSGLHRSSAGSATLDGRDIVRLKAESMVRLGMALVPEGRRLFADMTVEDNLLLGGYTVTHSVKTLRSRMTEVVDLFPRVGERLGQQAGTLSGGEQQMVAIGRALMSKPKVLLLDEPSLGLAPIVVADVMDRLSALRREQGLTLILVEQNLYSASRVVDRCVVLSHGSIALDVPTSDLIGDTRLQNTYLGVSVDADG